MNVDFKSARISHFYANEHAIATDLIRTFKMPWDRQLGVKSWPVFTPHQINLSFQNSCFISDVAWTRLTRNLRCLTSQLLIILLALTLLSESVVARPMYNNSRGRGRSRRGPKPKWVNPCGIDPVMAKNHALQMYHDVTPLSDQELIQNILLSAKNALVHSDDFKEKFVSTFFSISNWSDCLCFSGQCPII